MGPAGSGCLQIIGSSQGNLTPVFETIANRAMPLCNAAFAPPLTYPRCVPITVALVELGGARTLLGVPLFNNGSIIGIINLYRADVKPFTDRQIGLVQSFALQAVLAMENARRV